MNTRLILTKIVGAAALLPLVVLVAHADTLLTFERETNGSMGFGGGFRRGGNNGDNGDTNAPQTAPAATAAKQTVTVMMKGAKGRVEFRAPGAAPTATPTKVLLYDTDAQKVYTLDPTAKTYYVQTYKEVLEGERPAPTTTANGQQPQGGFQSRMSFTGDVDIKAARENSTYVTKDIGGVTAKRYDLSGSVQMQFNRGQDGTGGGFGGGRGGFGGRRGGGNGNNNYQNYNNGGFSPISYSPQQVFARPVQPQQGQQGQQRQFTPPTFTISGQVWLTPNLPLGSTRDVPAAAIYQLMLPDNTGPIGATLIKSFVAKMNSLKTIPSESTVSMGLQFNNPNADAAGPAPFSTHLVLRDQKNDATLDDALFVLPTDYKEVETPRQGFGGRGQGDRGNRGQGRGFRRGGNGEQQ